jgi:hypothetical protein
MERFLMNRITKIRERGRASTARFASCDAQGFSMAIVPDGGRAEASDAISVGRSEEARMGHGI